MAYEIEDIRTSQEIFYYLLEHHELKEETEEVLFKAYTENESVQNLVKSQGELARSNIERYGSVVYLIPKEENNFLGFSKAQLKAVLCKSSGTDKDYYLSQFVILTILTEFFDGQGSSSKAREYMRVGELQNCISRYLKEGAENAAAKSAERETEDAAAKSAKRKTENDTLAKSAERETEDDTPGLAFSNMLEAYEALRSDEKGSRAKTTKEGFLYHILNFLQKQGLIDYVEEDEMIKTTKKLDSFMDWNLLNQNNYDRVRKILGVLKDE